MEGLEDRGDWVKRRIAALRVHLQERMPQAELSGEGFRPHPEAEQLDRGLMGHHSYGQLSTYMGPDGRAYTVKRYAVTGESWDDAYCLTRVATEVQILSLSDHPNIVKLHAVLRVDDPLTYSIVTSRVPGATLQRVVTERGRMSGGDVRLVMAQLLDALLHVHNFGVAHRNVCPGTVMITFRDSRPAVTLMDFGFAKAVAADLSQTPGLHMSANRYAAPEYFDRFLELAPSTSIWDVLKMDIYSTAFTLCFAVAPSDDKPPFERGAPAEERERGLFAAPQWETEEYSVFKHPILQMYPDIRFSVCASLHSGPPRSRARGRARKSCWWKFRGWRLVLSTPSAPFMQIRTARGEVVSVLRAGVDEVQVEPGVERPDGHEQLRRAERRHEALRTGSHEQSCCASEGSEDIEGMMEIHVPLRLHPFL